MKKFFSSVVFLLCVFLLFPALASAQSTLDKIKAKGVIVAGVLNDSPPFSFIDINGAIIGLDPSYLTAVAARLGVSLQLVAVNPSDRLKALLEGQVDILAGNLTRDPVRGLAMDFSKTYLITGQGFLGRKGEVKELKDIFGKKLGVVVGTPSETCARNVCVNVDIVPFDNYGQALAALVNREIVAISTDQAILADLMQALPSDEFEISDLLISEQHYVFGARKGDTAFLDRINSIIDELDKSGEADSIWNKWFTQIGDRPPAAYGSIVRKAAKPPRYLAVGLSGSFIPKAVVAVYNLDGDFIGNGQVSSVIGDQVYLDVDTPIYQLVMPGFLVTQNVSTEVAKKLTSHKEGALQAVKEQSEKDAAEIQARIEKEGDEKIKRDQEMSMERERNRMQIERERRLYFMQLRLLRNIPSSRFGGSGELRIFRGVEE
ncbi:transporter substrate-binding domain-containing protein [bacterium]|nr:MAG: transporter substrate-binding domain-containing protein [bacterium]